LGLSAATVREPAQAFLVPSFWEAGDEQRFLRPYFREMFESELEAWSIEEAFWPAKRDLRTLGKWFEPLFLEIVFDLCDDAITVEEQDDES
jgi:hypothetical protein